MIRKYLPKMEYVYLAGRVTDLKNKTVEELRKLKDLGMREISLGVESGDSVIDATGALVGVIDEAGYNWSTVLTTVDTDTSLGARVFRTKDLGLAQGDFSLMGENLLRLDYLPSDCELLSGDLVETSGLGGFFPSGLVIGYVREVRLDDSGAASYAIVSPAVDFDELTEVFVIKSFDIVT